MSYKPVGYTSVAPYLTVNGAKRTIEFLIRVFAAEPLRMIPGSSDKRGGFMDEGGTTWWVSTLIESSRKV